MFVLFYAKEMPPPGKLRRFVVQAPGLQEALAYARPMVESIPVSFKVEVLDSGRAGTGTVCQEINPEAQGASQPRANLAAPDPSKGLSANLLDDESEDPGIF